MRDPYLDPIEKLDDHALVDAVLIQAKAVADSLPREGMEDGETRRALVNYRLHRSAHSRKHRPNCAKCVRTALRLVDAVTP